MTRPEVLPTQPLAVAPPGCGAQQLTIKESKEDDEERCISMLKTYTVFNEAQIEGLPKTPRAEVLEHTDEDTPAFINATQARINHGGDRAYYMPAMDLVWL